MTKTYTHVYNMQLYSPSLFEKLILLFRPLQVYMWAGGFVVWYKDIGHRLYVYNHAHVVVSDKRQVSDNPDTFTDQASKPWES